MNKNCCALDIFCCSASIVAAHKLYPEDLLLNCIANITLGLSV